VDYTVEARISFKKGVLDAEGETIQKSLGLLDYPVKKVETIRVYAIKVEANSEVEALDSVRSACEKLLANPVIQDFDLKVV